MALWPVFLRDCSISIFNFSVTVVTDLKFGYELKGDHPLSIDFVPPHPSF